VEALGAWNGRGTFDAEGTWLTASDHQTCLAAADALRELAARGFPPRGETHGAAGDGDEVNADGNGRADGEAPGAAADEGWMWRSTWTGTIKAQELTSRWPQ